MSEHEYEVPNIMDAALQFISYELSRILWNTRQEDPASPFSNSGPDSNYDSDVFSVHAYSWSDDAQPWNFKCGDVEISWYKYMGRGMSANVEITPQMASEILEVCLTHIQSLED